MNDNQVDADTLEAMVGGDCIRDADRIHEMVQEAVNGEPCMAVLIALAIVVADGINNMTPMDAPPDDVLSFFCSMVGSGVAPTEDKRGEQDG